MVGNMINQARDPCGIISSMAILRYPIMWIMNESQPQIYLPNSQAHRSAPNFIKATELLYRNNQHQLKIGTEPFPSITLKSGVRQGCPMSPTLFVLCIDLLLDQLATSLPSTSTLRAFADDIGLAITNRREPIPILSNEFQHFLKYSFLKRNRFNCSKV